MGIIKEIIKLISKSTFLPKRKKLILIRIIHESNFSSEEIEKIHLMFKEFAQSTKAINDKKAEEINAVNNEYTKEIKTYFFQKQKNLFKNKEEISKENEENELSHLLDEL
jgi:hypothetical protein